MAARATRSASRAASSDDDSERCLLLALSHDELGVIVDGLADPLQPVVAVALSSTCLGLRTPLRAALEVLKERHARAVALCRKVGTASYPCSCAKLRVAPRLDWMSKGLTADHMATLGMILRTNGLPQLQTLGLFNNSFGDAGVQSLCDGLGGGSAPLLRILNLGGNQFGPVGAEALAAALRKGAMPKLEEVNVIYNPISNQGVAALAPVLRKMPALKTLDLVCCEIGDEGVASLVANLGRDDFKALTRLFLDGNEITDAGCARLVSALDAVGMPKLEHISLAGSYGARANPASIEACNAVDKAIDKAIAERKGPA